MNKGVILAGEPMGLLIAQSIGNLSNATGYDLAIAGAEFNVAVGVARLGHKVAYLTKLGKDPFGERIFQVLQENQISRELVQWSSKERTGFMLKGRMEKGDPEIFYFRSGSAASTLSLSDVEKINFAAYSNLHMTGILPAISESAMAATEYMLDKARREGIFISFDPNLRPQLWESLNKMKEVVNYLASKADLVLPGIEEGKILAGTNDPKEINAFYRSKGAKICVTKCGSEGAVYADKNAEEMVQGFRVDKVVDTVGAGDGFAAGVITGIMENLTLREAVLRGNAIGAIQVMHRGDNEGLPTRNRLMKFMEGGR